MSLLLIILFSLALSVGGFFMRRDAKKSENHSNKIFGQLFLYGGLVVLIIGLAHSFLHKTAWTDDKKQLFLFILIVSASLYTLAMSTLFGLKSKKENNQIGMIVWGLIGVLTVVGAVSLFSTARHMNDGWTREKEKSFLENSDNQLDSWCQLNIAKQQYPNVDDYNTDKEEHNENYEKFLNLIKEKCDKCDTVYKNENSFVPGGVDDF